MNFERVTEFSILGHAINYNFDGFYTFFVTAVAFVLMTIFIQKLLSTVKLPVTYKFSVFLASIILFTGLWFSPLHYIEYLSGLNPRYAFSVIHPIIILKIVYNMDVNYLNRVIWPIVLLCTVGIGIFSLLIGSAALMLSSNSKEHVIYVFMYGLALSTIDSIESADFLREYESCKYFLITLEGECIIGTAVAYILLDICLGYCDMFVVHPRQCILILLRFLLGGVSIGFLIGKFVSIMIERLFTDACGVFLFVFTSVHVTYSFSEYVFAVSAPISTFIVCCCVRRQRKKLETWVDTTVKSVIDNMYFVSECLLSSCLTIEACFWTLYHFDPTWIFRYFLLYIINIFCRMLTVGLLAPIMVRCSRGLSYKSLLAIFWLAKKGMMQMCFVSILHHHRSGNDITCELMGYSLVYIIMSSFINGSTAKIFLKTFNLISITLIKKSNMTNNIRMIEKNKNHCLSIIKIDRYHGDVNWSLVNRVTTILNPYMGEMQNEENQIIQGTRNSYCVDCKKTINVELSRKEIVLLNTEAKVKILKAYRVSFIRQYSKGLLTLEGLKPLLHSVELAMETDTLVLNIQPYLLDFKKRCWFTKFKEFLEDIEGDVYEAVNKPPRKKYRRLCFYVCINKYYEFAIYYFIMADIILLAYELSRRDVDHFIEIHLYISLLIFGSDISLRVLAYSHIYIYEGMKLFLGSYWNMLEVIIFFADILWIALQQVTYFFKLHLEIWYQFNYTYYVFSLLRLLKIIVIFYHQRKLLITICQKQIDARVSYLFDIAQALMLAYDEIIHLLPTILENKTVLKQLKEYLREDQDLISVQLENTQRTQPWVSTTVKSKQAMRAVAHYIKDGIMQLRAEGNLDDMDFVMLTKWFDHCLKLIIRMKTIPKKNNEQAFYDIPWINKTSDLGVYLYINAIVLNFEANEVISQNGYQFDGVYLIMEGFAKLIYNPADYMKSSTGVLPVKDYLTSIHFYEPIEEYLIPGNSFGELSVMSNRPSNCLITCETPMKVFMIPAMSIKEVTSLESHFTEGIYSAIWKYITVNLASSMLWRTHGYRFMTKEDVSFIMMRSFVPCLMEQKIFISNEKIQDIILCEGSLEDLNANTTYVAPFYVPRSVQRLILARYTGVEPIIFIVPTVENSEKYIMNYPPGLTTEERDFLLDKVVKKRHSNLQLRAWSFQDGHIRSILKKAAD